jgi:hypothetical protein
MSSIAGERVLKERLALFTATVLGERLDLFATATFT